MMNLSPPKNTANFDSTHANKRNFLRIAGPVLLLIGALFILIGSVDFFSAFGHASHSMRIPASPGDMGGITLGNGPSKSWCLFVGMPLLFVGGVMTKFGYMGTIVRYQAGEIAPVGKDVINYMGREARPGIRSASQAIFAGRQDAQAGNIEMRIRRLEQMRDSGLINAEDFEEQKDRILTEL